MRKKNRRRERERKYRNEIYMGKKNQERQNIETSFRGRKKEASGFYVTDHNTPTPNTYEYYTYFPGGEIEGNSNTKT